MYSFTLMQNPEYNDSAGCLIAMVDDGSGNKCTAHIDPDDMSELLTVIDATGENLLESGQEYEVNW